MIRFSLHQQGAVYPAPCFEVKETVTVRIESDIAAEHLLILRSETGFYMEVPFSRQAEQSDILTARICLWEPGLYFFHLRTRQDGQLTDYYRLGDGVSTAGIEWQLSCYREGFASWKKWAGKVMYQIFPDRFAIGEKTDCSDKIQPFTVHDDLSQAPNYGADGSGSWNTDFYGGNLSGITEKLPYLCQLGVRVLYLNPIFYAPSNHRYDTADYFRIDPMLGTEADFTAMCNRAHALGIRVILDGVFSHTGADSVYFDIKDRFGNGAYHHPDSPYRNWYDIRKDGTYDSWWGVRTLPCVNETEPSFLNFITQGDNSVVGHWMRLGADGFRLDVADELPDAFLAAFHKSVKEQNQDGIVLGEVWEDASDKISYGKRRTYFTSPELDCVMNYPFRSAILDFVSGQINAEIFARNIKEIISHYPTWALHCSMVPLSTHDTVRALTLLGSEACPATPQEKASARLCDGKYMEAVQKLRIAQFLQFTVPGMPSIYYGDEAGMQGWEDPYNRRFFDWEHIDTRLHDYVRDLAQLRESDENLRFGNTVFDLCRENQLIFHRGETHATYIAVNCDDTPLELSYRDLVYSENCQVNDACLTVYKYGAACYRIGETTEHGTL